MPTTKKLTKAEQIKILLEVLRLLNNNLYYLNLTAYQGLCSCFQIAGYRVLKHYKITPLSCGIGKPRNTKGGYWFTKDEIGQFHRNDIILKRLTKLLK